MEKKILLEKLELVVNKLMNLGGADYNSDKSVAKEELGKGLIARDAGIEEWDWPQGVGLYGLLKLQKYYNNNIYCGFLDNWYKNNLKKGLPSKNINTTAPYLTLAEMTDNPEYEKMCLEHADYIMNNFYRTKDGGLQHVTTAIGNRNGITLNDEELWIDTIFMAVLFLNKMGQKYNCIEWISEAKKQVLVHIKYLFDKQSGLFYHGWSFNINSNFGGVFWCRGNAWFTYGIIDYIETCGDSLDNGTKDYLIDTYKAQVDALIKLQNSSGLWSTVLTDNNSYDEVSGSAAITAGILHGIKIGVLDEEYKKYAEKALMGICDNIAEDGTVLNVSAGTGMGYDAEHYKNIAIKPMAYGQSLTILALYEAL
jgi:Predicted unsaturated glucuronyl hydrolase involved in regulation of bacterial surface properties, and related proteins